MSSYLPPHLRVPRCPACHARLPVQGTEAVVVCEYCDARVEIGRAEAPEPTPTPTPMRQRARGEGSGAATAVLAAVLVAGIVGAIAYVAATRPDVIAMLDSTAPWPAPSDLHHPAATPPAPKPEPTAPSVPSTDPLLQRPDPPMSATPEAPSEDRPSKPKPRAKPKLPTPSGPVLSSSDAKAVLEPKVLACMRSTKTHALLAYMGNKQVGPVHLLKDSRTRVDGLRAKLIGTPLGRCIEQAGASVRARAFKSDYVRLHLRNDAVPDPLASLPAKADRDAIAATIAAVEPKIHACAAKHGEEGAREVFYFDIDGPTGTVISVRGVYRSRGFQRCAEAIYRTLRFDRAQEHQVKHTHHVQL